MSPPFRRATRYSASSSSHRHSPVRPLAMGGRASCGFFQRGRPTRRCGELTTILRSRLRNVAGGKAVKHLAEAFLGQVLVGILPDQRHWRVDAGAEALDFLPTEIPILGQMKRVVMDAALAYFDDVASTPQPAWRGPAHLHVGLFADRLQLEHRAEARDLQPAEVRDVWEFGDSADRPFRDPPLMLFLFLSRDCDH